MTYRCLSLMCVFAVGCGGGGGKSNPDAADGPPKITCDAELPQNGQCTVTAGDAGLYMMRGDVIEANALVEGGAVVVQNDKIVCVGCDCVDKDEYKSATVLECGGMTISPALINPHDHIRFAEGAPINFGRTFNHRHDWRDGSQQTRNAHGTGNTSAGMQWGELRMLFGGAASMIGSGRANGMLRNLDQLESSEEDQGFVEAEFETFSLGDGNKQFKSDCKWNYPFNEQEAKDAGPFLPHVAEGIDDYALEEFRCQSQSIGNAEDLTEPNAAHIHSIGLRSQDYYRMAINGTKLIWSARTNIALYGMTAQVQTFHRFGGTIALGTDWSYSGSANMLRELACVDSYNKTYLDGYFTERELIDMATINAAIASGNGTRIGSLEVGKYADIAIFAGEGEPLRRVLSAENNDVHLVTKAGQALFGSAEAVGAFDDGCDSFDMCGETRVVCTGREFGKTFGSIKSEVESGKKAYPAFFCGAPDGEPSCTPARSGEYDGTITSDDNDGDGIANDADNCPNVFNPIRPIDGGVQPDDDGDGIGDACDSTHSTDFDGDGVDNQTDNCPFDDNADQSDDDSDSRGNTCDACPDVANPTSFCGDTPPMSVSIIDVRSGAVAVGSVVTVNNLTVTGVYGVGATMQDATITTGENAGIFVFTGNSPGVAVGDVVNVSGEVEDFHGLLELSSATIAPTGTTGTVTPIQVTVAASLDEKYESVLVSLTDGAVTNTNYSCSVDNASCNDSGLWEIDNSLLVYDRLYQDNDWDSRKGMLPVSGVMTYRFDKRRIMPRTSSEIGN